MKKWCFVLPAYSNQPAGGPAVVYRYANMLTYRGHDVTILHTHFPSRSVKQFGYCRILYWYFKDLLRAKRWTSLDPRIHFRIIPFLAKWFSPRADIYFATAWTTAPDVYQVFGSSSGQCAYLIQGFETWDGGGQVEHTWKLPLRKVVISKWLLKIGENLGESLSYIPNGLDHTQFGVDIGWEERSAFSFGMLWHEHPLKQAVQGLEIILGLKERCSETQLHLFGSTPRPADIPDWINYIEQPTGQELRALYNRCRYFLCPSSSEGWGLTSTEAMQCGCCLITTPTGGHGDFAFHEETAWVSDHIDKDSLNQVFLTALNSEAKSAQISRRGCAFVKQFTWDRSVDLLERFSRGEDV